ncbi:MAG: hypothetical protein LUQ15_05990, partial [Methanothrix sp.]|nr:hypothetical protein [Methanothrix sp.]
KSGKTSPANQTPMKNISPPEFKSIPVAINPHHSAKSASVIIYENNIDRLAVVERGSIQRLIE